MSKSINIPNNHRQKTTGLPDFLSCTVLYYRTVRIEAQVPINPVMPVHIAYGHLYPTFALIFYHSLGIPHVFKILPNLILLNLTSLPNNTYPNKLLKYDHKIYSQSESFIIS